MTTDTIFFSYSRDDTEFVLNLAKSLRKAGANIWLDQLDIKPGTRWDSSIEKALESSKTLLVILSKTSVASHNVMDEVSYALEENKKVVPVLLEECPIPFRLKRLQYADFTADHQKGLKTLANALGLDQVTAEKLTDTAPATERHTENRPPKRTSDDGYAAPDPSHNSRKHIAEKEVSEPTVDRPVAPTPTPSATASENPKSKTALFVGGALVLLLVALWLSGMFSTGADTDLPEEMDAIGVTDMEDDFEDNLEEDGTIDTPLMDSGIEADEREDDFDDTDGDEPTALNAYDVSMVQYGNGQADPAGYFRNISGTDWEEESVTNTEVPVYRFEEVDRDEWSIYLWDESRKMSIQLDLHRRLVIMNYDQPNPGVLYAISGFEGDIQKVRQRDGRSGIQ